jgi:hypothetical protein
MLRKPTTFQRQTTQGSEMITVLTHIKPGKEVFMKKVLLVLMLVLFTAERSSGKVNSWKGSFISLRHR